MMRHPKSSVPSISYEAIAELEPDLILDVRSSGDQERYDRLSSIATTVGVPEGGDSWLATRDQQVEMISSALGQPEEGQALLEDLAADIHRCEGSPPRVGRQDDHCCHTYQRGLGRIRQ